MSDLLSRNIDIEIPSQAQLGQQGTQRNPVDIVFSNIIYQLHQKDGSTRKILNDVSGICKSGECTAILGASGAGKVKFVTSLATLGLIHSGP